MGDVPGAFSRAAQFGDPHTKPSNGYASQAWIAHRQHRTT
ncbi:hypothetical protein ASZ90_001026 [hydrocarbon metagenome]|uniref:Uncharacterized protein n=1 Tax=hydrocarbon metagenome TaxID=938273 RepID=A0A0W8G7F5_9ZZZZ